MSRNSHFQRGSGAYKCGACGRLTRHTGVQGGDSELCAQDWELAGIYNVHQDGGDLRPYYAAILRLTSEIAEKGGTFDSDARALLTIAQKDQSRFMIAVEHKGAVVQVWAGRLYGWKPADYDDPMHFNSAAEAHAYLKEYGVNVTDSAVVVTRAQA